MKTKTFEEVFFSVKSLFHLAKKNLELCVFINVFINGKHLHLQQSYHKQTASIYPKAI